MASLRDFLSGIIAGFLNLLTPFITAYIPGFPFSWVIYPVIFLGIWVVVATFILEKTGH